MKEYLVTWTIEIYANSEQEAAEMALEIQTDPNSEAKFFEVVDAEDHSVHKLKVCIDLNKKKEYSKDWKQYKKVWIQKHDGFYKIHYLRNDTEYSKGCYFTRKEANEALKEMSRDND